MSITNTTAEHRDYTTLVLFGAQRDVIFTLRHSCQHISVFSFHYPVSACPCRRLSKEMTHA